MTPAVGPPPRRLLRRLLLALVERYAAWVHTGCRPFTRLSSDRHERPLTIGETARLVFHRMVCRICRQQERRVEQLRALARELARSPEDDPSVRLSPEAVERMRRAVGEALRHGPGVP